MSIRTPQIALGSIAMALWLAGCGGSDEPPATAGEATVTDAGTTINGPDGVDLTVSPGAISVPTIFRIARDSKGAAMLSGCGWAAYVPPSASDITQLSGQIVDLVCSSGAGHPPLAPFSVSWQFTKTSP